MHYTQYDKSKLFQNHNKKILECSSKGDTRYSAFFARVKVAGVYQSIEEHYQLSKRFGDEIPATVKDAKGKQPTHFVVGDKEFPMSVFSQWYFYLWLRYLDENPELVVHAKTFDDYNDIFRGDSLNCQADAVRMYCKEGRAAMEVYCRPFTDLFEEYAQTTTVVNKYHGVPYDVYIGRGSKWGNPFTHKEGTKAEFIVESREAAVAKYREWIQTQPQLLADLHELKGKVLCCYCKPQACHGDVLAELANNLKVGDVVTNERIHIVTGNLLESDCTVIAHQANCYSTMGTGVAKSIREKYPEAYQADVDFPGTPQERLGDCSRTFTHDGKVVINLYGQLAYGRDKRYTDYEALWKALHIAMQGLETLEQRGFPVKFGIPYNMGCANAGGDWNVVSSILHELSSYYKRDIYVYKLTDNSAVYGKAPVVSGKRIMSFTGHRPQKFPNYDWNNPLTCASAIACTNALQPAVEEAILLGTDTFISGAAIGVDMIAAYVVNGFKQQYPHIRLVLAVPYRNHKNPKWSRAICEAYDNMLSFADEIIYVDEHNAYPLDAPVGEHSNMKLQYRNEFMVDSSYGLIAFWDGKPTGGTANCIRYALGESVKGRKCARPIEQNNIVRVYFAD